MEVDPNQAANIVLPTTNKRNSQPTAKDALEFIPGWGGWGLMIQLYSLVGDVVLDPFLGSGTTMLSARTYRRGCIGIEKESKYEKLIKEKVGWGMQNLDSKNEYMVVYIKEGGEKV